MARAVHFACFMLTVACLVALKALAQGETTSAIVGQVRDETNAIVMCNSMGMCSSFTMGPLRCNSKRAQSISNRQTRTKSESKQPQCTGGRPILPTSPR